ncbi:MULTISPECIES: hypothetical protein [Micromonospora]|nr:MULTISPECIES: hypothetical protein [Micromonospora]
MVDIERYSGRNNVLQHRAQQALTEVMRAAWEELGIVLPGTLRQDNGDSQFAVLPPETSERRVLRIAPLLDRLLREHNQGLSAEARVRVRVGVHQGLVHLDSANGFAGSAVVTVCRLVDSPQLKSMLRRFPRAEVALVVSDLIYQDVVRQYQDLPQDQFLPITASLPDKGFAAPAWVFVPGQDAAASTVPDAFPADPQERTDLNRVDRPQEVGTPQPPAAGQVFQHITSHGPAAFGNGNTVTTYGSADDTRPGRSPR